MTDSNQNINPFGKLLSFLSLLAVALYFTGWIYRWAYYNFFQLEVTTLNLPFESFYLAAFQVLFGSPSAVIKMFCIVLTTGFSSLLTINLRHKITEWIQRNISVSTNLLTSPTLSFLAALIDEIIIVLLILTSLFWLAQWQARTDAWLDAVNKTSQLPVVTVVLPEKSGLGREVGNPLKNPSALRVIGDQNAYNQLLGKELTDTSDPEKLRVWRLLLDRDGYFYIFPALPRKDRFLSVPVLTIYESSDQLTILSAAVKE